MPNYYIWTIGCQMNKAESERLGSLFEEHGYKAAAAEDADVIVLNSCVVRQSAEDKVTNKLDNLKVLKKQNPGLTLALTGCLVDSNIDQLGKVFPYVDHFFKPGEQPDWLEDVGARHGSAWLTTSAGPLQPQAVHVPQDAAPAVYVPIQQGCNNFCSYCIVPYRRGRERSRPVSELKSEVEDLVRRGAKEVTLVGQNVDSYGQDLPADPSTSLDDARDKSLRARPDLAALLAELNGIDGLARLRFLTNHPKDMSDRLIQAIASLDKVCEQFNLPIQSGDDDILKLMRRGYTVEHYRQLIAKTRRQIPEISISTDIIVGFPSETDRQFQNTLNLLAELRFETVHVAAYSPRPGTLAARELADDVPALEKSRRLKEIEKLQERISTEVNTGLVGTTIEILVEGRKKGKWQGRTRSGKLVFVTNSSNLRGRQVNVVIEKAGAWSLQGSL